MRPYLADLDGALSRLRQFNHSEDMKQTLLGLLVLSLGFGHGRAADSVVVFNEIHYHPASNEATNEWIELHNQMAIDIDLSAWSVRGGVDFTFAEGTIIPGG